MISYHILKCRKVSISVITAQSSWQRWKMRPPSENNLSAAAFEGRHASVHLYIEATHVWIAIQRWRCVCCISKIVINLFIHSKWSRVLWLQLPCWKSCKEVRSLHCRCLLGGVVDWLATDYQRSVCQCQFTSLQQLRQIRSLGITVNLSDVIWDRRS